MSNTNGIPEELANCLRLLLEHASFFNSVIEINSHFGEVQDGEEVEAILRKYISIPAAPAKLEAPHNCRNVLRDSGKPYPRSGCAVCKNGGLMGCPYEKEKVTDDEEIADELAITEHTLSPHLEAVISTWPEHRIISLLKLKLKMCHALIDELSKPKQEPYAYIDDKNRLVKISGHVYFDGGFVDANSEIPDSWTALVLAEKVGT